MNNSIEQSNAVAFRALIAAFFVNFLGYAFIVPILPSWQTQFDMKLYTYAKEIFEHQTKEWGTKERKKILKKEKKKAKKGGR